MAAVSPASITITPVRVADLLAEGERMPVYVHLIDHPDARVLVDTGMTELHGIGLELHGCIRGLPCSDANRPSRYFFTASSLVKPMEMVSAWAAEAASPASD